MNLTLNRKTNIKLIGLIFALILPAITNGQTENDSIGGLERIFMPAFQMGYVYHGTGELSGGLITQTSVEYRDISNFVFRINYDAFNSNMNLKYPVDSTTTFTGKTFFSDLIIGVGYKLQVKKHGITGYMQSGIRFYGYPDFQVDGSTINLDYDSRIIGVMRYSISYEYPIAKRIFLTVEGLVGHSLKSKDFWSSNLWYYGATIGVSAPLF